MSKSRDPGLELAPLPRDRIGPFLILGVAKDADSDAIESRWAQNVLWARQGKTSIALGDVHWAREVLRDPDGRLAADIASLNAETAADDLRLIAQLYHLDTGQPAWTPVDPDPAPIADRDLPDAAEICAALPTPELQIEFPGVERWLTDFGNAEIDPWSIPHSPLAPQKEDDNE